MTMKTTTAAIVTVTILATAQSRPAFNMEEDIHAKTNPPCN